jgi:hypothetical protein
MRKLLFYYGGKATFLLMFKHKKHENDRLFGARKYLKKAICIIFDTY